jgi:transcriptional regulator with XRE-family HTH domain
MTPAEEVADARDKLRLTRREFADALGLGPRGISQVQRWEKGTVKPNEATMTAMRLMVEAHELKRNPLPWMTPELWKAAHKASNELRAMAEQEHYRESYRTFCYALQVLRALLEQKPGKV